MDHRDDLHYNDAYPLASLHTEEEGKRSRSTIYKVTVLLTVVTILEVLMGVYVKQGTELWSTVKIIFIGLTLLKAFYIVFSFMHLGHETPALKWVVVLPYAFLIIYLLVLLIIEGNFHHFRLPTWL